jgi:hypothetical protein
VIRCQYVEFPVGRETFAPFAASGHVERKLRTRHPGIGQARNNGVRKKLLA